jgi:hypothetical protein
VENFAHLNGGNMKPALQALLISDDVRVRLKIMLGLKKITIREGHRDYRESPVMICEEKDPWVVKATITKVRHTTLSEVTKDEWEADDYANQPQMLGDLTKYYPEITMESEVTVIYWDKVEGALTNSEKIMAYAKANGIWDYLLSLVYGQFNPK